MKMRNFGSAAGQLRVCHFCEKSRWQFDWFTSQRLLIGNLEFVPEDANKKRWNILITQDIRSRLTLKPIQIPKSWHDKTQAVEMPFFPCEACTRASFRVSSLWLVLIDWPIGTNLEPCRSLNLSFFLCVGAVIDGRNERTIVHTCKYSSPNLLLIRIPGPMS